MYMGILTEKSYFCALSVTFLRLGCILKLEGLLQAYVKWNNTMIGYVNTHVGLVEAMNMGILTEKSYFYPLYVT